MNKHRLKQFTRLAAICAFLTVITTIGIHGLFSFDASGFEERLMLFENFNYLANRWWVIAHCLLVIVSMYGFFLLQFKKSPGYTGLGFVFYVIFAVTEIFRQMMVFFYLNGLRENYLVENNPEIKSIIAFNIENFSMISNSLFGLFILTFGLGCLFYGLSLIHERGFDKLLGYLLIIWFIGTMLAFLNDFWQIESLSNFIEIYSLIYQPIMRLLLGIWLWKKFKNLQLIPA